MGCAKSKAIVDGEEGVMKHFDEPIALEQVEEDSVAEQRHSMQPSASLPSSPMTQSGMMAERTMSSLSAPHTSKKQQQSDRRTSNRSQHDVIRKAAEREIRRESRKQPKQFGGHNSEGWCLCGMA